MICSLPSFLLLPPFVSYFLPFFSVFTYFLPSLSFHPPFPLLPSSLPSPCFLFPLLAFSLPSPPSLPSHFPPRSALFPPSLLLPSLPSPPLSPFPAFPPSLPFFLPPFRPASFPPFPSPSLLPSHFPSSHSLPRSLTLSSSLNPSFVLPSSLPFSKRSFFLPTRFTQQKLIQYTTSNGTRQIASRLRTRIDKGSPDHVARTWKKTYLTHALRCCGTACGKGGGRAHLM
ncbi:hypothetical protein K443DRAFT_193207 [Laccaria amethystina LaAM-08-1]|uniref:Uncharacterized protein n=1 Tax=Laccaria amethystina LaAM-08-1 TaxID=1095629 RepID=A0A0C9X190_9AGAR|nr:hypothetical protein K443DRAFT_193207 [Laccaria amethystina LaAM-08-1]